MTAVLVLSGLVLVHELGHFWAARRAGVGVEKFSIGFGPRVAGWTRGATEYRISAFLLGGYVKMVGEHHDEEAATGPERPPPDPALSYENKPVWARMLIIVAGPAANFLFGILLFWLLFATGIPMPLAVIGSVQAGQPAETAGLRAGDEIVAVEGKPVETWEDFAAIVHASPGTQLVFSVRRGEERFDVPITPAATPSENILGEAITIGLIGVGNSDRFITKRFGILESMQMSLSRTGEIVSVTLSMIGKLFQRAIPWNTLGGPILIIKMAKQSAQQGPTNLLAFAGFLSVSLGLFNLFPIPVLDGGQFWFLGFEALRGRAPSPRVKERVQQVGLVLLLSLMVLVFYNDIVRWVTGNWGP